MTVAVKPAGPLQTVAWGYTYTDSAGTRVFRELLFVDKAKLTADLGAMAKNQTPMPLNYELFEISL